MHIDAEYIPIIGYIMPIGIVYYNFLLILIDNKSNSGVGAELIKTTPN
jgi:hypothetical protein